MEEILKIYCTQELRKQIAKKYQIPDWQVQCKYCNFYKRHSCSKRKNTNSLNKSYYCRLWQKRGKKSKEKNI